MRIKLKKAIKSINLTPTQKEHIIRNIPQSVIDRLTSKELTELIMAMHKHYHEGKRETEKEIAQHIGASIWTAEL